MAREEIAALREMEAMVDEIDRLEHQAWMRRLMARLEGVPLSRIEITESADRLLRAILKNRD